MSSGASERIPVPRRPKGKGWVFLQCLTGAFVLGCLVVILHPGFELNRVLETLREWGPLWYYAALAILPVVMVPTSPFYFLAGAAFPLWINLLGTSIAVAINLTLSYAVAVLFLRNFSLRLAEKLTGKPIEFRRDDAWVFSLMIKLAPGVSATLKSWIMGAAGVPFAIYFIVSWSITMTYAIGLVFFGSALQEGNRGLMLFLAMVFIGSVALFTYLIRSRLKSRKRSNGATKDAES